MIKKGNIVDSLTIIFGNILLAIGGSLFLVPFSIDAGGLNGVSVILKSIIDPGLLILILNWALFLIGFIFLKKEFALKTLLSTIVYPIVLNLLYHSPACEFVAHEINGLLLVALIGAALSGTGLGIVYKAGGSTGGLDIICVIFNKYFGIKISYTSFTLDAIIVLIGMFTVSFKSGLYGIITVAISSYLIEAITMMGNSSYMMHIVSDKYDEINNYIINELERGSTIIKVYGGINHNEKEMIEVIFNSKEYYKIKKKINEIDSEAFLSVYKALNVYGNGFESINRR